MTQGVVVRAAAPLAAFESGISLGRLPREGDPRPYVVAPGNMGRPDTLVELVDRFAVSARPVRPNRWGQEHGPGSTEVRRRDGSAS